MAISSLPGKDDFLEDFRTWLRPAYQAAGYSRPSFAREMGVSENTVIAWEKGSEPGAWHWLKILMILRAWDRYSDDTDTPEYLTPALSVLRRSA